MHKKSWLLGLILAVICVVAESKVPPPPPDIWQCHAYNSLGHRWYFNAHSRHRAMLGAQGSCRQDSVSKCMVDRRNCVRGRAWVCSVRDTQGRIWKSQETSSTCLHTLGLCRRWYKARNKHGDCQVVASFQH